MRKTIDVFLILGFLFVDFLFFHDLFKPGEITTLPQYLTGALSLVVFAVSGWSLFEPLLKKLQKAGGL